jgi:TatD DNase family protein
MFIDTHSHIYLDTFDADFEAMLARAHEAGVKQIVMPAIDVPSIEKAIDLAEKHEGLYVMSAIHPCDVEKATEQDLVQVEAFCAHPKVVAVGETGLDFYWDRAFDDKQRDFFRWHIRLAMNQNLPLIIHTRTKADNPIEGEANWEAIRLIQEEKAVHPNGDALTGIFHCFSGGADFAQAALDLGFYLGLGGVLTYKKSTVAADLADVPMERLVLETDAPFLPPQPRRGKRNEPSFMPFVAEKLAETKGISLDEVAQITTQNAKRLFRI